MVPLMAGTAHFSLRSLLIGATVILTLLLAAPAAQAEELGGGCPGQVLEYPFAPWEDGAPYTLMPDGDLTQGGAGWDLGGAEIVDDNEPWYVHGGDTPAAVRLDTGDVVTTPPICITPDHPTMRFFVRDSGGDYGTLTVDAVLPDGLALPIEVMFGMDEGDAWAPSAVVPIFANLVTDTVRFRFSAVGSDSAWVIDDVFVDPYGKG
jgi:hypothetical protein